MKRTRTGARNNKNENDNAEDTKIQSTLVASEKTKLNLKSLRSTENAYYMADTQTTAFSKRSRSSQKETGTHIEKTEKEFKRKKVVDLQMMKAELSQLEDPPITLWDKKLSSSRLQYKFFDIPCEELAQHLLGKVLVRYLENGTILKGRIVETEGYLGAIDKASHSYQYKITPRNLPMYMPPGTIYIYMTYGMYHCFNISSQGDGCAVLVRAVEPLEGVDCMADQRNTSKIRKVNLKPHELCNGPSKLCMAYQLSKQHNKYSLCTWKGLWIEDDDMSKDIKIVKSARIGIDSCGPEWANKPLRYYILGNKSVSKKDKKAEMEILTAQN